VCRHLSLSHARDQPRNSSRPNAGKAAKKLADEQPPPKRRKANHKTATTEEAAHLEPDCEDVFVVERIVAEIKKKSRTKYLVKWQGYDDALLPRVSNSSCNVLHYILA